MVSSGKKHGSASTAQRLLDAAERLFGEHGYNGVGMRALAQAAGRMVSPRQQKMAKGVSSMIE